MSFWNKPMVAANRAVSAPTIAMTESVCRSECEQHGAARDNEQTGCHHRGGVDERRDRCRARHRVRQPHVKRDLGGFAGACKKECKRDKRHGEFASGMQTRLCKNTGVIQCSKCHIDREHRDKKSHVADAVDDERLHTRVACPFDADTVNGLSYQNPISR